MLLFGCILAAGSQIVWAQADPSGQFFYQQGAYPPPQYSGMELPGYPPGANAWPNISPYGPVIDQHYTKNGFWFNRIVSGQSRYFATMEALITRTGAPPHAILGEQGVNDVPPELILDGILTDGITGTRTGQFVETDPGSRPNNPDRNIDVTNNQTDSFVSVFDPKNAGILQQKIGSGGLRGSMGWWNPDQSGFMLQGFWQSDARSQFQAGDNTLPEQLITARTPDLIALAIIKIRPYPLLGLALPGDDRDADGLDGVVVPYDLYVDLQYVSSVYGGNLDWYFTPTYDGDYFKIRPLAGARVMTVNELFSFDAGDSNLGYTLSPPVIVGGGGGGNQDTNPRDLAPSDLDDPPYAIPSATGPGSPIQSYLMSRTEGFFAGPEVGLRFDIGGDKFKVFLQSKFGLLAYQATRKISGFNIGDHYNIINDAVLATNSGLPLDPDTDGDGIPDNPLRSAGITGSTFEETRRSTQVAPMFEQGIFFEAPVLGYVPIIKKLPAFEQAQFQVGYTFMVLGAVYRPTEQIAWRQFPDFPTFERDKSKFYTQNLSLGVHWDY
jgi:hypothetical protein